MENFRRFGLCDIVDKEVDADIVIVSASIAVSKNLPQIVVGDSGDDAIFAFDIGASDFLLSNTSKERFALALERVSAKILANATIAVKERYHTIIIPVAEIIYIEAMVSYTQIYWGDGKVTRTRMGINRVLSLIPNGVVQRIHRSYAAAISHVESHTKEWVKMHKIARLLPIGECYTDEFIQKYRTRNL